jgi:putative spermidine/putrescine transport system ATP-binding protein
MFDGKVEQEDEPRNFYERPQTERVARFFGTLNLIPGSIEDGMFVSDLGRFPLEGNVAPGPSTLAIRQEQIEVGPGENHLRAQVERTMYLGTVLRVWVRVNGTELQFIADPRDRFHAGEQLELHVPREHLWVVPGEAGATYGHGAA